MRRNGDQPPPPPHAFSWQAQHQAASVAIDHFDAGEFRCALCPFLTPSYTLRCTYAPSYTHTCILVLPVLLAAGALFAAPPPLASLPPAAPVSPVHDCIAVLLYRPPALSPNPTLPGF